MKFICSHCGNSADGPAGEVNRAIRNGRPKYCGKTCFGLAHRLGKTEEQKKAAKAAYDAAYRVKNINRIKKNKREYFQRTYDPAAAREHRKRRMPSHVEYCRRPEYREKKRQYDADRRASEYGPYAAAYRALLSIEQEVKCRASWYEVAKSKGTLNKHQSRRRAYDRLNSK